MKILLIEVKPGNDFKSHRSLDKIRAVKDWQGAKSLVFCKGNVERDGELYYLPWFSKQSQRTEPFYDHRIPTTTH